MDGLQRNVLVVYYSRVGHTKKVAQKLAEHYNAEIAEIRSLEDFSTTSGSMKEGYNAFADKPSPLSESPLVLDHHTTIWIGCPVHCWNVASPMHQWLIEHRSEIMAIPGRQINGFCTLGGVGQKAFFEQMEKKLGLRLNQKIAVPMKDADAFDPSKPSKQMQEANDTKLKSEV